MSYFDDVIEPKILNGSYYTTERRTRMAYEVRDNSGSLFTNDKQGVETRPDWNGTVNIDGKMYWISAWEKDGAKGKFFSLSFKPKEADFASVKESVKKSAPVGIDFDELDTIPF